MDFRRQPAAMSVHLLISRVVTPGCEPLTPPLKYLHITLDSSERADQTRRFLLSFGRARMLQTRKFTVKTVSVRFGEAASHSLSLLPFLSSIRSRLPSVSPGFIYRLRNCRGGDGGRDGKSAGLLPEERAHYPPLSSLFHSLFSFPLFSLFLSFLKSSSALL